MHQAGVYFPASQRQNVSALFREELCASPPVLHKKQLHNNITDRLRVYQCFSCSGPGSCPPAGEESHLIRDICSTTPMDYGL